MASWHRGVRSVGLILLLTFCIGQVSRGQVASAKNEEIPSAEFDTGLTISKAVDEVRLNFTVTNKRGKFIKGLGADDFKLLDNQRAPERLVNFKESSDSPLRVVLLFDISTSIRERFQFEQKAANHFLTHVLRPGIDEAAIIAFGSDVREVQSMTGDLEKLTSAVSHLRADGDTTLYDAVARASSDLRKSSSGEARRVMIILSDGDDTTSHATNKDCKEAAVSSEALILVVDASFPSQHDLPGQKFLKKMAENSGGLVIPARESSELKDAFGTIGKILRSQYALSYEPAMFARDGGYRPVQLTSQKQGLVVHSRVGYYAGSK